MAGANSVSICFRDFHPNFDPNDNLVVRALSQHFSVVVEDDAEFCFLSLFGTSHETFRGPKVEVIGEPESPRWGMTDFAIGFDRSLDDRFLRYPSWAWRFDPRELLRPLHEFVGDHEREFCLFLYSNPNSPMRNAIFTELSSRRFVTSPGRVFNNSPSIGDRSAVDWRAAKVGAASGFRFTIAAENARRTGYVSEKLPDAFTAGSIPIYWGDPLVDLDFDTRCFLDLSRCASVTELADRVVEVDEDAEQRARMLENAPLRSTAYEDVYRFDRVEDYLRDVVHRSRRRPEPTKWKQRQFAGVARRALRATGVNRLLGAVRG